MGAIAALGIEDGPEQPYRFAASTLSTLIAWDIASHIAFFSELEFEDFAIADQRRALHSRSDSFEVERLYTDVFVSDALALRIGKFLTPVGRWNTIHAAPLVWTTSRPLVSFHAFAQDTTGSMLHGLLTPLGQELEYAVYMAFPDDLDPDREDSSSEKAWGARLQSPVDTIEVGISYMHFVRQKESDQKIAINNSEESRENLFGLDFLWGYNRYELSGEAIYRVANAGRTQDEWGLFLQGVAPLTRRLFAIGRYERFKPSGSGPDMHVWVIALAFRSIPPLILKAEYIIAHGTHGHFTTPPDGFTTSISLLF